jgi:hypothetical protein
MSMKVYVTLERAVAVPGSRPIAAASSFELSLDENLLSRYVVPLHEKIQQAFAGCERAIADELPRHQDHYETRGSVPRTRRQSMASNRERCSGERGYQPILATQRQMKTLYGMSVRYRLDLGRLLYDRFRKHQLYELSRGEAGCLIGELQKLRAVGRDVAP